eukprot:727000-Pelagomonas_calceolata.AAC.3
MSSCFLCWRSFVTVSMDRVSILFCSSEMPEWAPPPCFSPGRFSPGCFSPAGCPPWCRCCSRCSPGCFCSTDCPP